MDLRKLDALVAEKVMGYRWVKRTDLNRDSKHPGFHPWSRYLALEPFAEWQVPAEVELPIESTLGLNMPEYSTDIAAAWDVVNMFDSFELKGNFYGVKATLSDYKNDKFAEVTALSGPMTICLAALKTKGIDVSEWEK